MSNEPALKAIPDDAPTGEAASGEARLRAEIAEILGTIAQARTALADARQRHDEAETLLRDAESRARIMQSLLGPETDVAPPVADAEPAAPVDEAHLRSVEEQAFLDALGLYDPIEASTDDHDELQDAAAPPEERVPTVSGVVSQLGRGGAEPVAPHGDGANAVRMLEAMVEELAAAMPVEPREQPDEPRPVTEAVDAAAEPPPALQDSEQPSQQAAEQPELEAAEPEALELEVPEPPSRAVAEFSEEAVPIEEVLETPEAAEPAAEISPEPPSSEPAAETEAAVQTLDAVPPETPDEPNVTAAAQASDDGAASERADDDPSASERPVAEAAVPDGDQKDASAAPEPRMPENELLTSFAQMATRPFLPPEIGTAVIFDPARQPSLGATPPSAPTPPSPGDIFASVLQARTLPPDVVAQPATPATPLPTQAGATVTSQPEPASDTDLDALLFGTSNDTVPENLHETTSETARELSASPPWPEPAGEASPEAPPSAQQTAWAVDLPIPASARAASQQSADEPTETPVATASTVVTSPAVLRDGDPLAPLRAMSDEEKIALFE